MSDEEWRSIEGFPNYEVSSLGRVRDNQKIILKQRICSVGYYIVNLINEALDLSQIRVHRLVAMAFISNPNNLPLVDHINQNKLDNSIENLRWLSKSGNAINSKKRFQVSGERNIYITSSLNYIVRIKRTNANYCKVFKTLEEAIQAREKYLSRV